MFNLFKELYFAKNEEELDKVVKSVSEAFNAKNWYPLGGNENNFGVIENQQSSPIAALIEKITNSIDAILMRKCYEEGIHPTGPDAPKSMEEAIERFFPQDHKSWDLPSFRKRQSENIQIIADGPRMDTSLIIYDDGEGQHPEDFEDTFLSLLRGNKNEIHFVQGKYNMGGSGSIVFCGKKRYQLIASRRFDCTGKFGFTLIREHPLSKAEEGNRKNTWYEYLKINGEIPSCNIDVLDLGLYNRQFRTGTIIKLYSYGLPEGSRSVISKDLNQSLNEYLFEPALPILTVDKKERYPKDINLERDLYGLKRRLEQDESKYVEEYFSEDYIDQLFGQMKVTCYVFRTKLEDKSVKDSRDAIRREFFKNNMSVLFSVNGQVHGHFTSEFITRSLKLNLLKGSLIVHVNCTSMNYNFRKELFMASRDRLKDGEETRALRHFLARKLGAKDSRLALIEKRRKDSISVDSGDTKELLKTFTQNLPMNSELLKLLGQTFKLDQKKDKSEKKEEKEKTKQKEEKEPFNPNRFPTYFKLRTKKDGETIVAKISIGGEKSLLFDTDVEDQYFDRIEEPGELKMALLDFRNNENSGGDGPGSIDRIEDVFNVNTSSPHEGTIRVVLNPKKQVQVGDAARIKVTLCGPAEDFDQIFWVKISEPNAQKEPSKKVEENGENLGLPELVMVYKDYRENSLTWDQIEEATGNEMKYETVMYPLVEGENLEKIYINMDSSVIKNFKSKYKNASETQIEIADRKYISSVYFHTVFLFTITKNRKYGIVQETEDPPKEIDVGTYLKDLFSSYYSEFILNFGGTNELLQGIGE